ncbi:hypothetical protein JZ751_012080 [Albula glossodonta]|uniref:Uncharacterized protein n=1 Tax=Albula glossodonta TaxID=121402 RepID=A0A8T2PRK2_9TELE|nr:hypothetical protein JZ751_012080 [Albula glossodonta]
MTGPLKSPDLNIIKAVWDALETQRRARYGQRGEELRGVREHSGGEGETVCERGEQEISPDRFGFAIHLHP